MRHFVFRTTTDKLGKALDTLEDDGVTVLWPVFLGGRDWVLVCRNAAVTA